MPTYEYECTSCGYKFEISQKMTDSHLRECPKCQKEVRRLISSGAGIIFKGSGFYSTDYRKSDGSAKKDKATPSCGSSDGCSGCPHAH